MKMVRDFSEGYLTSCSFDYMTEDFSTRLFTFILWVWDYLIPLIIIIVCYSKITSKVMNHEKDLKKQVSDRRYKCQEAFPLHLPIDCYQRQKK